MPSWTAYKTRPKLLDVTVNSLAAGQTDFRCPTSGSASLVSGSNSAKLTNANISSLIPQGLVGEALLVTVTSPIQDAVTFPDASIWFSNGTADLSNYQVFDVGYPVNMLPTFGRAKFNPEAAQVFLLLGYSTREMLRENLINPVENLPTKITGYKVDKSLTLHVASSAGWTSSAIVPMRVRVYGDFLDATDLEEFLGYPYDGTIQWDVPPTEAFLATHEWPGLGTLDGWTSGPGGTSQTGVKVNRRIVYAYNAKAAASGARYVLSDSNSVRGNTGNVSSADTVNGISSVYDPGEALQNSKDAVLYDRAGFNLYTAGQQAYVAWSVGGQLTPQETDQGKFVTANSNNLAYGNETTTGGGNGTQVVTLANVDALGRVLMHRNNVAPVFQSVSGTIAAGDASFAAAGTKVEVA